MENFAKGSVFTFTACMVAFFVWVINNPRTATQPQALQAAPMTGECVLSDIRVVDGDTLEATIHLGLGVQLRDTIRINNYDAWESRKIRRTVQVTDEEVEKGKLATLFVEGLVTNSTFVSARLEPERDAYGRVLGTVFIDGIDLAELMRENGHVRPE